LLSKKIEKEIYCQVDGKSYQRIANIVSRTETKQQTNWLLALKQKMLSRCYFVFYFLRSAIKWMAKRRLVPAAKKFTLNEVQSVLVKLKSVEQVHHCQAHAVFLSSAVLINSKSTESH
jgi:hypothetical protein